MYPSSARSVYAFPKKVEKLKKVWSIVIPATPSPP
jgi:hypothetical protein